MKTEGIFYVAPNKVELRDLEVGDPDLYQVQIELKASAICAWDQALSVAGLASKLGAEHLVVIPDLWRSDATSE